ncbi:hypothetical protein BSKO_06445 [Bryopsis sp. KO-2023]|nr:hypothetical protein BSKO_06445 [Bryopsis sp. KO-2023]
MEPWMKEVVDLVNYRPEVLDPWCPGVTVDQIRKKSKKRGNSLKEEPQWLKEFNKRKWVLPKTDVGDDESQYEMFKGLFCSKEKKEEFSWVHRLLTEGENAVIPEHDISTLMEAHRKLLSRNRSSEASCPAISENCSGRSFKKIPGRERRIKDISHHIDWGKDFHDAMEECLDVEASDFPSTKRPRWLESIQPTEENVETAGTREELQLQLDSIDEILRLDLNSDRIQWPQSQNSSNPPEWSLKTQLDRIACRIDSIATPIELPQTGVELTDSIPSVCCPSEKGAKTKPNQRESTVSDIGALAASQTLGNGDAGWGEGLAGLDVCQSKGDGRVPKALLMCDVEMLDVCPTQENVGEVKGKDMLMADEGAMAACQTRDGGGEGKDADWFRSLLPALLRTADNGEGKQDKDLLKGGVLGARPTLDNDIEVRGGDLLGVAVPAVCQTEGGLRGIDEDPVLCTGPAICQTQSNDVERGEVEASSMAVLPNKGGDVEAKNRETDMDDPAVCHEEDIGLHAKPEDSLMGVGPAACQSQGNSREGKPEASSMSVPGVSAQLSNTEKRETSAVSQTGVLKFNGQNPHTGDNVMFTFGMIPDPVALPPGKDSDKPSGTAPPAAERLVGKKSPAESSLMKGTPTEKPHTGDDVRNSGTNPKPVALPPGKDSGKPSDTAPPAAKRLVGKKSPAEYSLMKGTPNGEFLANLDVFVKVRPIPVNSFGRSVAKMSLKQEERWVTGILLDILEEVKMCRQDRGDWKGGDEEDPFSKVQEWLTGILASNPLNHRCLPAFESSITQEDIETLKGLFDGNLEAYLLCMAKVDREQRAFRTLEKACLYPRALKAREAHNEVGLHQLEVIISLKRARVRQYPKTYDRIDTVNLFGASTEEILYSDSNTPEFSHVADFTQVNPRLSSFGRIKKGMYNHFVKSWNPKRALAEEEIFVPLAKDPAAKRYADGIGADLLITSEALRAFASVSMDPKCGEGFEIPFSSSPTFASGKLGKRLVIDSPLLGRKLGLRERDCMKFEAHFQDQYCNDPRDQSKGVLLSYHYSHWTMDGHPILVRRIDRIRAEKNPSSSQTVCVKPDYLEGLDEMFTRQELLSWWMESYLREPSSPILVQRLDVFRHKMGHVLTFKSGSAIVGYARQQGMRIKPRQTFSLLQKIMARFAREDPGSFLLTHCPGQVHSTLYLAVNSDNVAQHPHPPLPIDPAASTYTGWFDLHKAHENSGEFDKTKEWFLPPHAKYYFADMPGTFPKRLKLPRSEIWEMVC